MKRIISVHFAIVPTLIISGCQLDTTQEDEGSPKVVVVSEQTSGTQDYNVDLTREDAVYVFAPALDTSRLSVTCPNLSTISFAEYLTTRILPTAVMYDPTKHFLQLANAVVPLEPLPVEYVNQNLVESKPCVYSCYDNGAWEQCINPDC